MFEANIGDIDGVTKAGEEISSIRIINTVISKLNNLVDVLIEADEVYNPP
jgi:hypothetical protein